MIVLYNATMGLRLPLATPPPLHTEDASAPQITLSPTTEVKQAHQDYHVSNVLGPTPPGFFVIPSLFQHDLEKRPLSRVTSTSGGGLADGTLQRMTAHTDDIRLLVQNLEVCVNRLGPHKPDSGAEEFVDVMSSCKGVISGLLRWLEKQRGDGRGEARERLDEVTIASSSGNVFMDREKRPKKRQHHGHVKRALFSSQPDSTSPTRTSTWKKLIHLTTRAGETKRPKPVTNNDQLPKAATICLRTACEGRQLRAHCKQPSIIGNPDFAKLCKICFPRNEAKLRAYCVGKVRRDKGAFILLAVLLIVLVVVLAAIILVKDTVRRKWERQARRNKYRGKGGGGVEDLEGEDEGGNSSSNDRETEQRARRPQVDWKGVFHKVGAWSTLERLQPWASSSALRKQEGNNGADGQHSTDIENGQDLSFESFKSEEALVSPFDRCPSSKLNKPLFGMSERGGRLTGAATMTTSSLSRTYDVWSLRCPSTPPKIAGGITASDHQQPPQLPPLSIPAIRLSGRSSSIDHDEDEVAGMTCHARSSFHKVGGEGVGDGGDMSRRRSTKSA
ncbi:hypothetical protein KEM55_004836 [Ascosphaera atra]|nr:hypothetical protein KEM55_004836 [Ascosphaera atra]